MKKQGCLFTFFDILLVTEAITMIAEGEGGIGQYMILFLSGGFLVLCLGCWLVNEIRIRKRMREIRQQREAARQAEKNAPAEA